MDASEYHKLAAVEDRMWYFRALHGEIGRRLAANLSPGRSTILDAGCGTGGLIRRLSATFSAWQWTGVDISEEALTLARTRVPANVPLVAGSVERLPFEDKTFDAVVSADVLYHVDDDVAALREACRVLKPGGALIVNVPAYRWLWSYHDTAVHSRRRYSRAELITKVQSSGFRDVNATYRNAVTLPVLIARRKLLPPPKSGSDVGLSSPPIELALNAAMAVESMGLRMLGRLPFGSSVFCVARRPVA